MKKIYISAALFAALTFGVSCNKVLDFTPPTEIDANIAIKTANDVQSVLMMSYQQITSAGFLTGAVIRTSELYGDNVNPARITGDDKAVYDGSGSIFNSVGRGLWANGYTGISRANNVIYLLDTKSFPEATQAFKDQLRGEALFLRAVAHFELVRLFAKPYTNDPTNDPGVPLRVVPITTPEQAKIPVPRAKVAVVYAQVIQDLKDAIELLPTSNGSRANKMAAKAYLARVLFNKEDYSGAYDYANDVITNSGVVSDMNITAPFRMIDKEAGDNDNYKTRGVLFQVYSSSNSYDVSTLLRNDFWNTSASAVRIPFTNSGSNSIYTALLNNGGSRLSQLVEAPTGELPYSSKWQGLMFMNVPIIRLTEMYLTRAEAGLRAGKVDATTAAADVNYVRSLAGVSTFTTVTLEDIQAERRVELVMEGDRFHELRRLKQNVRSNPFNSSDLLLKIPDSETNANSAIEQN
ncbi:SusD family protein [Flexibacter flexilis DSM 6793]|uniref:SusD family protein n=1 Tax=Flexibacter flexilis DSM 6793 TaxID=927664 RepID=A0A1I1GSW3_9BACT|nr:RagB/SusD family nutrient uptake outer membrane protein [Flexibacter flexilis]SFC12313.1 SusD family protein [Flexibacter flexilis DSM 6793]